VNIGISAEQVSSIGHSLSLTWESREPFHDLWLVPDNHAE